MGFSNLFAQKPETNPNILRTKNWVFGDSVLLKFTGHHVVDTLISFSNRESSYSISNTIGELQYFGSPNSIYSTIDKNQYSLIGENSSNQGSIIVNDKKTRVFTTDQVNPYKRINCYVNTLNNDSNGLLNIRSNLLHTNVTEQLTLINHQSNNAKWLCLHKGFSDSLILFNVGDTIIHCPSYFKGALDINKVSNLPYADGSSLMFSPSGKYLLSTYLFTSKFCVYEFNTENGDLNLKTVQYSPSIWSAVFSPNEIYIYLLSNMITQYRIVEKTFFDYKMNYDNNIGNAQVGIDGKIYIAMEGQKYLGTIENPDFHGNDSKYIKDGLKLIYGICQQGLPNFNQSYFYTPSIDFAYKEDCIHHNYDFEGRDTFAATSHTWRFTKGNTHYEVKGKNINRQFVDTGIWQVNYIAGNGQRSDTAVKKLTILPQWPAQPLGADTFICPNQTLILRTPPNMHCIHWQGQEPNLDTANGPILDYDHFHQDTFKIDQKGVYTVKLTNKTFCQMRDSVEVKQAPAAAKPQISFTTKELASTIKANVYRWFLNDSFLLETPNRSIVPTKNGFYQLQIISEFGCESLKSDSFYIDLTGIDNFVTFSFEVFPNPTQGIITLQVPHKIYYTLFIYDVSGKLTKTQIINHQKTDIDLTNLPKGIYTFKLKNEKDEVATKAVMLR